VNASRPPARCRMPVCSARFRSADARSGRAAAATTTRSLSAALDGSAASRAASSPWRSPGTGSGSPGAGRTPCSMRARAISSANNGLPSDIRWIRNRTGCVRRPSVRALRRRVIASSDNPDRRILQTTDHERQRPGRGHIQPLDVVDGDEHRTGRGQRAQDSQRRDRHRSLVRWGTLELRAQEGGIQRALLRGREVGELEVEEVSERRTGEQGLRFRPPAGQHPVTSRPGDRHARMPQGRLADPGRSLQEQGRGPARHRPDEGRHPGELALPPKDPGNRLVHPTPPPPAVRSYGGAAGVTRAATRARVGRRRRGAALGLAARLNPRSR
jgi:hypothetical protein